MNPTPSEACGKCMTQQLCASTRCAESVVVIGDTQKKLADFGAAVLKFFAKPDGPSSIDYFDLVDMGVKAGTLELRRVTEPCGEGCACAAYADLPVECHQMSAAVAAFVNTKE